jgi:DNA mismatch endonuclease, patch repair protein
MSRIRGRDTTPEMTVRRLLHGTGFRYRLHSASLPGRPDIVLTRHRAVVFVHGCFWHGHGCHLFKWPATRCDFWRAKILRNRTVDGRAAKALKLTGWRVATVWECALKGKTRLPVDCISKAMSVWLRSRQSQLRIEGATGKGRGL